jgi:hypothetical protein
MSTTPSPRPNNWCWRTGLICGRGFASIETRQEHARRDVHAPVCWLPWQSLIRSPARAAAPRRFGHLDSAATPGVHLD